MSTASIYTVYYKIWGYIPIGLFIVLGHSDFWLPYMYVVINSGTLFRSLYQAYWHSISFNFKLVLA